MGTHVLINVPNIQVQKELDDFETTVTGAAIADMYLNPLQGKFDFEHLTSIHREIFKDVYPFAGIIRDENIAKDYFMFCPCEHINTYAKDIFLDLKKENHLKELDLDTFSERAGHYLAEINIIHPFREGNGRTQREFIRLLALQAGYEIDWSKLAEGEMIDASKRSVVDSTPLAKIILKSITNK